MDRVFSAVDNFFSSLQKYLTYNEVFVIFVGLFLLTVICVVFSTTHSYESKLVKAIDMLNAYFVDNPKITEENLVAFNQKMRGKKIPKQLRKQWQQFVLYRENKASYYMSFENCVEIPLRNSKFKRDKVTMNLLAYVFAGCALVLNSYFAYEADFATVLQRVLLAPVIILLVNYIVTIFLDLKENAVIGDLYQNYQYFEVNIDKATKTIPEYVDYEILFEKNEIKKGIPILYAYLQKRAEEEQRELEKARLKNVEHEKFNFDEAGLAGSLVLERAMQEAENYIAERKKYNQDIEQINSEITQEDMNYREITKEYNRQMQVSRETFANFKSQLEEATSTIEINYLKKQQQQELDRQRNLERDFDTATERHKKVIESYQAELDSVDTFIAQSRKSLQDAMMSEFSTYSSKVYDEAKKVVEEREKEKYSKTKQEIKDLEEKLHYKDKELENIYGQNLELTEKLDSMGIVAADIISKDKEYTPSVTSEFKRPKEQPQDQDEQPTDEPMEVQPEYETQVEQPVEEEIVEQLSEPNETEFSETEQYNYEEPQIDYDENNQYAEDYYQDNQENVSEDYIPAEDYYQDNKENVSEDNVTEEDYSENQEPTTEEDDDFKWLEELTENESTVQMNESEDLNSGVNGNLSESEELLNDFTEQEEQKNEDTLDNSIKDETIAEVAPIELKPKKKAGRPRKVVTEASQPKRKPGRPKKEKAEEEKTEKRKPGRPKKIVEETTPKKKPGRPRKQPVEQIDEKVEKRKPGRPKKSTAKKVGRPRRVVEISNEPKKPVGRPKKVATKKRGRPSKAKAENAEAKRKVGRPRKVSVNEDVNVAKKRGRPKKSNSVDVDIEAYLKVIDNAIAKENARMKKTQKALEDGANLSTKKKK